MMRKVDAIIATGTSRAPSFDAAADHWITAQLAAEIISESEDEQEQPAPTGYGKRRKGGPGKYQLAVSREQRGEHDDGTGEVEVIARTRRPELCEVCRAHSSAHRRLCPSCRRKVGYSCIPQSCWTPARNRCRECVERGSTGQSSG